MIEIPYITDSEVGFGSTKALPPIEDIPREYLLGHTSTARAIEEVFQSGVDLSTWKEKEGVDRNKALRVVKSHLRSFDPKHEHKIGGVAWLVDQWFESVGDE